MSTILALALLALGFVIFNFLYWRNLKEDYISTKILSCGLLILLSSFFGGALLLFASKYLTDSSIFIKSGLWFWGSTFGFLTGVFISKWRFGFKFNESFDAAINGLWALLAIFSLSVNLVASLIFVILLGFYYLIKKNYKKFTIYKSGKIGIAGLITVGLFFTVRAVVAIFLDSHMISLIGKVDGIMSATAVFISFLALYFLAYEQK